LIASIGVFRLESSDAIRRRSSGTGGFALIGESTIPIVHDLNAREGRDFFGLDDKDLDGVRVVPVRVRDGEDASCLNLNRAQVPRLLGVRPEMLAERHAFTFVQATKGTDPQQGWQLLKQRLPDGAVPAVGDAASIQWALGKKIGDTLPYTDERGRHFRLRLVGAVANSILQGSLIIAEDPFLERFPSESGYRLFLVDVQPHQPARMEQVAASLSRAAQDYGMELTQAARRLAAFNAVQNTYLNTFQVLGGLGLLLGSVGLGVVVLRNVLERRGELALLLAVGFRARALRWLVLSEHGGLLLLGLVIGILSALVAVLPTVLSPASQLPVRSLTGTLGAVFVSGALWTWLATHLALRGKLLDALRDE
jgi:putative ABC transport system permease protein